jgi:predicted phage tail protein
VAGLRAIYPATASGGLPPQAPTAITNSVVLDTVTVSWTPSTAGGPAQSYILEAGSQPGLANLGVFTSNGTATSFTAGGVLPGVYHVRVRARNALGTSPTSPSTTVIVGPCTAPGPPSNLAALVGDNNVTLMWSPPTLGIAQGYTLSAGTAPGLSNALVQPLSSTPTFFGVAPLGSYYVRLAARNSCGTSAPTADVLVSVQRCTSAPAAPTGLSFTKSGSIVTLAWTPPAGSSGPARYVLSAGSTAGGSNLAVQTTPTNAPTFSAFAPPGRYFVRIQGQNACGTSGPSNEVEIAVP